MYEFINNYGQREFENLKLIYVEMLVLIGFRGHTRKRYYLIETGFSVAKLINSELLFKELKERIRTPNVADFKKYDISWIADFKFHIAKAKPCFWDFGLNIPFYPFIKPTICTI